MRETHPAAYCDFHVLSACGPVREENQDAGVAWREETGRLALVVADGMGGHAAGREAAEIVVASCLDVIRARRSEPWDDILRKAVEAAQAAVHAAKQRGSRSAMGATAVLAVVDGDPANPSLHAAHVGDSRLYLYRDGSIRRLTDDHSLVAQMVRDGLLEEEEAFGHPDANVIHRAIGQQGAIEPEIREPVALQDGDVVLACSDGLHGAVPDRGIADVIAGSADSKSICRNLLAAALAAGSADNVTIACARIAMSGPRRRLTQVGA